MNNAATAELLKAIERTSGLLSLPGNDFTNSPWRSADAAIEELATFFRCLEDGDLVALDRLGFLFAPKGALQEVGLDSGWCDEFLDVASDFDRAAKSLRPSRLERSLRRVRRQ